MKREALQIHTVTQYETVLKCILMQYETILKIIKKHQYYYTKLIYAFKKFETY